MPSRSASRKPPRLLVSLLSWYAREKRVMPWRGHPEPYAVWVSEIMLQQTRVETVIPYFERFMARFRDVKALAEADLQDVLRLWQGLGYYTRARNLHQAARLLCDTQSGSLPRRADGLRSLPGVGSYTAAAIASICFGERVPVIDGNVLRVVSRVLRIEEEIRKPPVLRRIEAWLDPLIGAAAVPGDFNQAMMELGALVCTPKDPRCHLCPFSRDCRAYREDDPLAYPVKASPRAVPTRTAAGLILRKRERVLLAFRSGERFLGELWELPGGFCGPGETPVETLIRRMNPPFRIESGSLCRLGEVRHVYSHFRLELHIFEWRGREGALPRDLEERLRWVRVAELDRIPLSNAPRAALRLAGLLPEPQA